MSKLAMHIQHFKKGSIGAIDAHNKRTGDEHSNELIVPSRSELNIPLVEPEGGSLYAVVKEAAANAAGRVTANSVLLSEWVIYPSEDLQNPLTADPDKVKAWGNDVLEWMKTEGITVAAAYIHFDETTVHMHVDTMPITPDGRFCRKEIYTRSALNDFHTKLPEYLAKKGWDIQRGDVRPAGKKGKSKTVREYKAWAEKEKARIEQDLAETKKEHEEAKETQRKWTELFDKQAEEYEENKKLLEDQAADIQAAVDWLDQDPKLEEEVKRFEEIRILKAAAEKAEEARKLNGKLLKEREQILAALREDLQLRVEAYTHLKAKKKEAWEKRSDAEKTVAFLEEELAMAGMVKGIILRIGLCGAKKYADEARRQHENLCAAVREQKHKIQSEQAKLMEQSEAVDKLLKAGAEAALHPESKKVQKPNRGAR